MDDEITRVLFVCAGNSCRSQMAEGWVRHPGGAEVVVESADIEAHGKNPRAISVMRAAGVDISAQESTRLTAEMIQRADIVISVCGHADEHRPSIPPGTRKEHWPLDDNARAQGSEEEILKIFRLTRDRVRERVVDLRANIERKEVGR